MADPLRALQSDKGMQVQTTMTDEEAYEIICGAKARLTSFTLGLAQDYKKFRRLTPNKAVWFHKYAQEILRREQDENDDGGLIDLHRS